MTVIHQTYFLPWLGYFSKLAYADKFIVFDNVEFTKGFYLDRTKYISSNGEIKWLSLQTGQNFKRKTNKVTFLKGKSIDNILKTIEMSYAKADFYKKEWPFLKEIILTNVNSSKNLVELNIGIIINILELLNISIPKILFSSDFKETTDKTERIINLCKSSDSSKVLLGDGNSMKIHNWSKIQECGIEIYLQDYFLNHPSYKQIRRQKLPFKKGVSIIDTILNIGRVETKKLIWNEKITPSKIII